MPALPSIHDIAIGTRFLFALPGFLRRPVAREEAQSALNAHLADRPSDFLRLARRGIYDRPRSPYRALLRQAGCEYGDLERLVQHNGLEGALNRLCRLGVYLTVDELRGGRAVIRGSASIYVDRWELRNPWSTAHLAARSGGSRGASSSMRIDLASLRAQAGNHRLVLDARGCADWRHAHWGVPGSAVMGRILQYAVIGARPERWFSQVHPASPGLHARYRWSARVMRWGSNLAGSPLPCPEYVPPDDPAPIANWMAATARHGQVAHLGTFPSSALRVCQAALDQRLDLDGAQFTLSGEPLTAARLASIRSTGAVAHLLYGSSETGILGWGCLGPDAPDDVHLSDDMHALIRWGDTDGNGVLPSDALLVTSLRSTARMLLLNASLGDQAHVTRRHCGCPLEALGWTTHLHTIRSYEKLTAGGLTLFDQDVVRVLEEVLPSRFGGLSTDYQLVEEEDETGRPRVLLLVDPSVGSLEPNAVAVAFFDGIGAGSGVERVVELQWRQAGLLRVERRPPLTTSSGKLLHLHQVVRLAAGTR